MSFKYHPKFIRNFSIIAHIDHGKSTISDRLLEYTGTVETRDMEEQVLDKMDLERERGITIKAHPVTMYYTANDGNTYQFNFIDTPGHVDFSYEVSRSLAACEGALLIVDAVQGVQAQTLANVYLAIARDLEIIPVLNKVDLPAADPERIKKEIEEIIGLDTSHTVHASGKTGLGIDKILEQIVEEIPPPIIDEQAACRALIFDSHYDPYQGVMIYLRVISGELKKGTRIVLMATKKQFEVLQVGTFSPHIHPTDSLKPGEVGYLLANIKKTSDVKIGDTITTEFHPADTPLPGFQVIKPVVYAGIYPIDTSDFENVKEALTKLQLNDSALYVEQENSLALGFGFRCGFLGLLHLEIVFERLQREFNLDILTTSPSVVYHVFLTNGTELTIDNPARYPDPTHIVSIHEPWVQAKIMIPNEYLGNILSLALEKRGTLLNTESGGVNLLVLTFDFPLNEIMTDFNDQLKSVTKGYGSFDYEFSEYRKAKIIKLEIRINDEIVDPFSCLIHEKKAEAKGRSICQKLKELIPRQQFKIPIQAAIGGKVIARETISALSKNVTAKCYGGDITRKRKLWEKQKAGKKKMKEIGKVTIPQSAFMKILRSDAS